jgi:PIN domain nuclease of toxin-antitoxin system
MATSSRPAKNGKPIPKVSEPLLLDTHCWIWMQDGRMENISPAGKAAIRKAAMDKRLLLSAISVWEIGLLESKGRISLAMSCERWVAEALTIPGLRVVPVSASIALMSTRLPGEFHSDPADRILVATARIELARLLTKDQNILEYGRQKHVSVLSA